MSDDREILEGPASRALDALRQWEAFGGVWHLVRHSSDVVTVSLCRCDGGEEVDRLTSRDPDLIAYVDCEQPEASSD